MRVSLFITCLVDMFQPQTGVAAVKVLKASGAEVSCPMGQTCCGQPAWNSGFADEAAKVARTSLDALEADAADAVVVPAGSCATMMRIFWPEMFELVGDHASAERARQLGKRTYEFSEFVAARRSEGALPQLDALGSSTGPSSDSTSVAYHHSCHMLRELRIDSAPTSLVEAAGCSIAEWPDDRRCCGFGGLFSVKLPEISVAMADDKLTSIPDGVDFLCGSDGSCLMHLRGRIEHERRDLPVKHLAEVLADAIDHAHVGASDGTQDGAAGGAV